MLNILQWFIENIYSLNNSKFFSGLIMLLMNIGSKYITIELSKTQSQYLSGSIARQLLIFCISWMGTRDIFKALALTAFFNILTNHLFNENSDYCIVPHQYRSFQRVVDTDGDGIVSDEEVQNARKILEKARQQDLRRTFLQGDWNN
jgi:hypothetical protein